MVTCRTCGKEFPSNKPPLLAEYCAAIVCEFHGRLFAICETGSAFQGKIIDLTASAVKPEAGTACDACIQKGIDGGGKIYENKS